MFCPASAWPAVHRSLTRDVPQPLEIAVETPDVLEGYVRRIQAAFSELRARTEAAKLDALIIIGDDQTEVFSSACIPQIAVYLGQKVSGTTSISWLGEKHEDNHITFHNHPSLAREIVTHLLRSGFDPAFMEEIQPLGRPSAGIGHAFSRIAKVLHLDDLGLPTIPLFLNGYHAPMPSGARCLALGLALRALFEDRPERIGIYASGGLSHCPMGPRAGWIDTPLDRWILERLERGESRELANLFNFESDTLHSGTGEIRSWITAAGAFDSVKATILDYIPAHHAVTGLGFAYWEPEARYELTHVG